MEASRSARAAKKPESMAVTRSSTSPASIVCATVLVRSAYSWPSDSISWLTVFASASGDSPVRTNETAPFRRILKIRKENDRSGRVAEIEDSSNVNNADDFDILKIRHEAKANGLPHGITSREKAFREAAVHDGQARVFFIIGFAKVPAAKQKNPKRLEKARGNCLCICHYMRA